MYRNLTHHQVYGGASQDHLPSFQYTQQVYTLTRGWKASLNMLFRHTYQPLVPFSGGKVPLQAHSR